MTGRLPSLITGANAKIKFNDATIAFATEVQFSVSTDTIPVEVMGAYEVKSNEPVAHTVNGSFRVIRYIAVELDSGTPQATQVSGASATGNAPDKWKTGNTNPNPTGMFTHINPGDLLLSKTVDLEVYTKAALNTIAAAVFKIKDCRVTSVQASLSKREVLTETFSFVAITYDDDSFTSSETLLTGNKIV